MTGEWAVLVVDVLNDALIRSNKQTFRLKGYMINVWIYTSNGGLLALGTAHVCLCVNPKEDKGRMKRYDTTRGKSAACGTVFHSSRQIWKKCCCVI